MQTALKVIAVLAIQAALLVYMIWDRISIIRTGTEVELQVEPVDPRSLFRGDYVILTYGISQLNTAELEGDNDFGRNDRIFVELVKTISQWEAVALYKTLPAHEGMGKSVFIRGQIESAYQPLRQTPAGQENETADRPQLEGVDLSIAYGVESYFVPEGEGRQLEDIRDDRKMSVVLAVRADGTAAIKKLIVDGELYHEEGLL